MSLGRNLAASARTCTWSTRPIEQRVGAGTGVPPLGAVGVGTVVVVVLEVVQPDHSPSVRVRTSKLRSSSDSCTPCAQVTPTEP